MAYGTQSYSEFGNELNIESINNLRLLTAYNPTPSDSNVTYSSSQVNKTYSVDLSTFFDPDFTFDPLLWEFLVVIETDGLYTPIFTAVHNGTNYLFSSSCSIKQAAYSIIGTILTITKSTEDYAALSGTLDSQNNFCNIVGCTAGTTVNFKAFRYSGGIFNIFLKEI
jgi:hypothetical protein